MTHLFSNSNFETELGDFFLYLCVDFLGIMDVFCLTNNVNIVTIVNYMCARDFRVSIH